MKAPNTSLWLMALVVAVAACGGAGSTVQTPRPQRAGMPAATEKLPGEKYRVTTNQTGVIHARLEAPPPSRVRCSIDRDSDRHAEIEWDPLELVALSQTVRVDSSQWRPSCAADPLTVSVAGGIAQPSYARFELYFDGGPKDGSLSLGWNEDQRLAAFDRRVARLNEAAGKLELAKPKEDNQNVQRAEAARKAHSDACTELQKQLNEEEKVAGANRENRESSFQQRLDQALDSCPNVKDPLGPRKDEGKPKSEEKPKEDGKSAEEPKLKEDGKSTEEEKPREEKPKAEPKLDPKLAPVRAKLDQAAKNAKQTKDQQNAAEASPEDTKFRAAQAARSAATTCAEAVAKLQSAESKDANNREAAEEACAVQRAYLVGTYSGADAEKARLPEIRVTFNFKENDSDRTHRAAVRLSPAAYSNNRAFELPSATEAATELLTILAEIAIERAKSQAFDLVATEIRGLVCNELVWEPRVLDALGLPPLPEAPSDEAKRILPRTCNSLKQLRLQEIASSAEVLSRQIVADLMDIGSRVLLQSLRQHVPEGSAMPEDKVAREGLFPAFHSLLSLVVDAAVHKRAVSVRELQSIVAVLSTVEWGKLFQQSRPNECLGDGGNRLCSPSVLLTCGLELGFAILDECRQQGACTPARVADLVKRVKDEAAADEKKTDLFDLGSCKPWINGVAGASVQSSWPDLSTWIVEADSILQATERDDPKEVLRTTIRLLFRVAELRACSPIEGPTCSDLRDVREAVDGLVAGKTHQLIVPLTSLLSRAIDRAIDGYENRCPGANASVPDAGTAGAADAGADATASDAGAPDASADPQQPTGNDCPSKAEALKDRAHVFTKITRVIAAFVSYASTYQTDGAQDPAKAKELHENRKKAIEGVIDGFSDRSSLAGRWVFSIGASAGLFAGAQWINNRATSGVDFDASGAWPQLSVPMGLAFQRLPSPTLKPPYNVGFHLQISPVDLGQFIAMKADGTIDERPEPGNFACLCLQIGALFGTASNAGVLAVDARWIPTLKFEGAETEGTGVLRLGITASYYVSFLDIYRR